jgi:F0F1-type ATP synthase assembly protein I
MTRTQKALLIAAAVVVAAMALFALWVWWIGQYY